MTPADENGVSCEHLSAERTPERPTDPRRSDFGRSLDVTEAAERRADSALSDFGAAAMDRRWRRGLDD